MPWVTDAFIREYEALVRTVKNIAGPGVRLVWGQGVTINKPGKRWERPAGRTPRRQFVNMQVGTATNDGVAVRKTYAMTEVYKTTAGYGGWTTKTGGLTGTGYNRAEVINELGGQLGNGVGVDMTGFITGTGIEFQAVPLGSIVLCEIIYVPGVEDPEYWFTHENGMDGDCEP